VDYCTGLCWCVSEIAILLLWPSAALARPEVRQMTRMIPRLRKRILLAEASASERDGVIVISLRGELDIVSLPALQACLSDFQWPEQAHCVVDLAGLAFIDCACLGVLARHCAEIRARGGSFALAGPHGTVLRLLSVTGWLTWFELPSSHGMTALTGANTGGSVPESAGA
jgi:anti-sigma B factor antagonist